MALWEKMPFLFLHSTLYAALRGAATLKARALKEVWNIAAVTPLEKGMGIGICGKVNNGHPSSSSSGELAPGENYLGICSQDFLAKGTELLKRTRKGNLQKLNSMILKS